MKPLPFGKRMWLQVKAPVTQMHSADAVCQLQIFVIIKSQKSFCVPGCSFAQRGIQGYSEPEEEIQELLQSHVLFLFRCNFY